MNGFEEIDKKLREPFTRKQIGKLPKVWCKNCSNPKVECTKHQIKKCGVCKNSLTEAHNHVDFVGHAHVTERLLDVDPTWNWEPMGIDANGLPMLDEHGGLWIKLTIGTETRIGYGHADGRRGGDPTKVAIGDAIRIAAMRFGVALEQWMKDTPDPVAEKPAPKEEPTLTPQQRAGELRKLIAGIGFQDDKTIEDIAAEFHEWSGKRSEINTASVAVLAEYLEHLKAKS